MLVNNSQNQIFQKKEENFYRLYLFVSYMCLDGKMKLGRKRRGKVGRFNMSLYEPGKKSNVGRSFHQQKGETFMMEVYLVVCTRVKCIRVKTWPANTYGKIPINIIRVWTSVCV